MTVQLNPPPNEVDRVTADEVDKRQAREEAGRSIREICQGHILGPDLTVRDLIEEGRR